MIKPISKIASIKNKSIANPKPTSPLCSFLLFSAIEYILKKYKHTRGMATIKTLLIKCINRFIVSFRNPVMVVCYNIMGDRYFFF